MNRRPRALFAAALAGLMLSSLPAAGADAASAPELVALDGPALRERIASSAAPAVLVNVWATWCQPCREEMPLLLRLRQEYRAKGVELLLVSGDFSTESDAARAFLGELGVDFATFIKSGKDMEFIDALHTDWSGALPATFVYSSGGDLVEWWQGIAEYERFAAAVDRALAKNKKEKP